MAEIEAFLRTGEAPPPAPEPRPVASLPPEGLSPPPEGASPPADPFLDLDLGPGRRSRPPAGGGFGRMARFHPIRRGLPLGRPLRPVRPVWPLRNRSLGGLPAGRADHPAGVGGGHPRLPLLLRLRMWLRLGLRPGLGLGLRPGPRPGLGLRLRPGLGRPSRLPRSARDPRRPGLPPEPPRWTLLRALALAAVLGVLLILPSLYPSRSTTPGGADHASAAPAGPGYSFLRRNRSGTPVRWNPCSPIYYVTNLSAAPAWAAADLQRAVVQISRATGILFVAKGSTTTFPGGGGDITAGGQAGPVVIAWADPAQTGRISLPAAPGRGAPAADSLARTEPIAATDQSTGRGVYVTGTVLIGAGADRLPQGFGPGGLGVLLLHELGHLMGLGNVNDAGQVMDAGVLSTPTSGLGSGDRAGLARLGTGSGCLQVPASATFQPAL